MKHRSWPLLALAFGALVLLIGLSGVAIHRHTGKIYAEVVGIQEAYRKSERVLNDLRAEMYSLGILVRDYLLDPSQPAAGQQRQQLLELRASMEKHLAELEQPVNPQEADAVRHLRRGLGEYWSSIEPIFEWTPAQRVARGSAFLRQRVVPYRNAVLSIAREIGDLNSSNLRRRQDEIRRTQQDFQSYLQAILATAILLGLLVAGLSIARISVLEKRAERHRLQTERDRAELRSLSQKLVRAQEEERKSISRELHDQFGQMLTALRMELGNLEDLRGSPGGDFKEHLTEAKSLAERTLRGVRDMAMGLRPSMLDDLGLAPAVEWQAREFARRSGLEVSVQIDGSLENLPESHRTCIYRVVQEALTNCARHSQAKDIRITLHGRGDLVSLTVQDDGVGFTPQLASGRGLGLVGIEERVRELGGEVSVFSQPRRGTLLRVEIPSAKEVP
jgi:signal transduction histidine kinase